MKLKGCKIIAVTPFWKRAEISKIYWQGIQDLRKVINIEVMALISDKDNEALADKYAEYILVVSNARLGIKWDSGIYELKDIDFDYLLILGSDDICSPRLFRGLYRECIERGEDYFGIKEAMAMDMQTGLFRYWEGYTNHRIKESLGVARMISRRAVEKCGYMLFPRDRKKGMDLFVNHRLNVRGFYNNILETKKRPYRIGLKVDETISKNKTNFIYDINLKGYYSDKLIKMIK